MKRLLKILFFQLLCMVALAFPAAAAYEGTAAEENANSWRYEDGQPIEEEYPTALMADPYHPDATLTGIDVSKHQGDIDWERVKASGVDFAIIRCGFGEDKTAYDDVKWHYNASECERLGIPYGVYLYSYAFNEAEAESEADHVLRLLEGYSPTMPVYYDMEDNSTLPYDHAAMAKAFCTKIQQAGYPVGVYASLYWWNTYLTDPCFDSWYRWVAQWNTSCAYTGRYEMWQYSNKGSVDGINGDVDMNFLIGYPEDHNVLPKAPAAMAAVKAQSGSPTIVWSRVKDAKYYEIHRKASDEKQYTCIDTTAATRYTDNTAQPGVEYSYQIRATGKKAQLKSPFSNTVQAKCILPVVQPRVYNMENSTDIKLRWDSIDGAKSYRIYRAYEKGGDYSLVATVTDTEYAAQSFSDSGIWWFKIVAVHSDSDANSAVSRPVSGVYGHNRIAVGIEKLACKGEETAVWQSMKGADCYEVYLRGEDGDRLIAVTTQTEFDGTELQQQGVCHYIIKGALLINGENQYFTAQ